MITLYVHSSQLLWQQVKEESATTFTNIGKWFGDLKQRQTSADILKTVTEKFNANEAGFAHFYLAFELKRTKDYTLAVEAFHTALPALPLTKQLKAYEQLAILYEHHLKDYQKEQNVLHF